MPFQGTHFFGATPFFNGVATRSLRSPYGADPLLSRTPSSAGNRKIYTISLWFKRATLSNGALLSAPINASLNGFSVYFDSDKLTVFEYKDTGQSSYWKFESTREFRDTSNWYHMVLYWQTDTYSSDADSIRVYINGSQIAGSFTGSVGADYQSLTWNNTYVHEIFNQRSTTFDYDGYMAEFNFIDGQALTPTSFGETKNGVWIPKDTSGLTFGTNGFRLQFIQTGTGTASASTIGADTSGNTHHFTSTNLSAHDSNMPDSPENVFCTLNHLSKSANITLAEGGLKWSSSGYNYHGATGSIALPTTGKWYFEAYVNTEGSATSHDFAIGIISNSEDGAHQYGAETPNNNSFNNGATYVTRRDAGSRIMVDGSTIGNNNTVSYAATNIVSCAFDADSGKIWFARDNSWWTSAYGTNTTANAPSSGANQVATLDANHEYVIIFNGYTNQYVVTANFGQDSSFGGVKTAQGNTDANGLGDFYYAVPTGFLAVCTENLPEPTIGPTSATQASDHFNTLLYTGDGASTHAITGNGFKPDMVWQKSRSQTHDHFFMDSNRGATLYLKGSIDSPIGEVNAANFLKSFDTDGVTVGDDGVINNNTSTYAMWNWKANGGTTATDSNGDITSTVQVNSDAGFSIVTFTGDGTNGSTIGHGLAGNPGWILIKDRDTNSVGHWMVWHQGFADLDNNLFLNLTNALNNAGFPSGNPNASTFVSAVKDYNNVSSNDYVAYIWKEIEGYSKFGKYKGSGGSDGPFVYTGFTPAWVMIKNTARSADFRISDIARQPTNDDGGHILLASSNAAEVTSEYDIDFVSNGFKLRSGDVYENADGESHIFMAFAQNPFKLTNAN